MANFPELEYPAFWVPGRVLSHGIMKSIDARWPKIPNFMDGSTHAPTSQVVVGGSGMWISGASRLDNLTQGTITGQVTVSGSGDIIVATGTTVTVQAGGSVLVQQDGALDFDVPDTLPNIVGEVSCDATWSQGAPMTFTDNTTFALGTWPRLSPARSWERHSLKIVATTYTNHTTNGPDDPDVWIAHSNVAGGTDCIRTRNATAIGDSSLLEILDLPDGSTIQTVVITSIGTAAGAALTLPTYRVIRWKAEAAAENMSAITTDAHVLGDWAVDILTTSITITSFATIDKSYRYGVRVTHPYDPANAAFRIYDVKATGTASDIRL